MKSVHTDEYGIVLLRLVEARTFAGLTQSDLAARIGKPQSYVSKYERGERRLDVLELIRVCQVLNIDTSTIVCEIEKTLTASSESEDE